MNMSDKKQTELYGAISDPIVNLRLKSDLVGPEMDHQLFKLEQEIWNRVKSALRIKQ